MQNRVPWEKKPKTFIHQEAYQSIDHVIEEWLIDPSFVLWDSWYRERQKMGDFLTAVCGCISLKSRVQGQDAQKICDTVQRFQTSIRSCDMTQWSDEERVWLQTLLNHPLVFDISDGEEAVLC